MTTNTGFCQTCDRVVPVTHEERDNSVYLVKHCPDCGKTEFPVSSDAAKYNAKRELAKYDEEAALGCAQSCALNCKDCDHGKIPSLVFIDVTNRCNMNCPICLANIPAMGFRFDPPIGYFEKIFQRLTRFDPVPKIQLFGGEPTVREDLIDIIELAKTYGIKSRVVTNGLRLADEEYCKRLLDTRCQLMFSFDGRGHQIYDVLRKSPKSYNQKLKALENVRKHRRRKITIMCATGEGVNDEYMGDLLDFCHEGRDYIAALDLIPLVADWGPEKVEAVSSSIEDVERIMARAKEGIEFFPAGMLYKLKNLKETFNLVLTFGGSHPNCESVSLMVSDGTEYKPLGAFLKRSQNEVLTAAAEADIRMGEKLRKSWTAKIFGSTGEKIVAARVVLRFLRENVDNKAVFGDRIAARLGKMLWGLLRRKKLSDLIRKHTRLQSVLRMIVLPFEDKACIESARLVECPASFAYESPVTGGISLMPVCAWTVYKDGVLRQTAEKWGTSGASTKEGAVDLNVQPVES